MAKVRVLVIQCDKCGHSSEKETEFRHVVITTVPPLDKQDKRKLEIISERDLCSSCFGLPGVNRDA